LPPKDLSRIADVSAVHALVWATHGWLALVIALPFATRAGMTRMHEDHPQKADFGHH
jgi:hypothetical protein